MHPPPQQPATPACETFDFGAALAHLRSGKRVQRAGWNGKGMHLELVTNGRFEHPSDTRDLTPFIVMYSAQGTWVPWLASQTDVLATDWRLA